VRDTDERRRQIAQLSPFAEPESMRPLDRSRARAWTLEILYRWEVLGRPGTLRAALDETLQLRSISPRRRPYIRRLLTELDRHLADVDLRLSDALDNWRLDRLSALDRGVLRIAAVELLYMEDIPPKVAIQEGILLAERYGGPESPRFVNGVLDALYRRIQATLG